MPPPAKVVRRPAAALFLPSRTNGYRKDIMTVTIIHSEDCPRCDRAIAHYRGRGIEPKLYPDLDSVRPIERRNEMAADMMVNDGDLTRLPIVFEDGRYVDWEG